MWCEIVAFDTGNWSRSRWQGHALSAAIVSSSAMRRGSANAFAMSSNCRPVIRYALRVLTVQ
jgi:hypothetical protein